MVYYFPPDYYDHNKFVTFPWDGEQSTDLQIVKCKKCNLVYQNPCINENGLKYVYPTNTVHKKMDYNREMANHKFQPLLNIIKDIYPEPRAGNLTIMDIGTRYGLLPELLSKQGFNSFGVEYNEKCVEAAHESGFNLVTQGIISDLKRVSDELNIPKFNMVILNDVIEHLLNPREDIQTISKFQGKGDRIIIKTMDVDAFGHKLFRKEWYYIHSQHTFYFSKKTLKMLFEDFGYEIEHHFQIPAYKTIKILGKEIMKCIKHKNERKNTHDHKGKKIWFGENRPHLFDEMTIVLRKN